MHIYMHMHTYKHICIATYIGNHGACVAKSLTLGRCSNSGPNTTSMVNRIDDDTNATALEKYRKYLLYIAVSTQMSIHNICVEVHIAMYQSIIYIATYLCFATSHILQNRP